MGKKVKLKKPTAAANSSAALEKEMPGSGTPNVEPEAGHRNGSHADAVARLQHRLDDARRPLQSDRSYFNSIASRQTLTALAVGFVLGGLLSLMRSRS